jgi:hypothetical protein
MWIINRTEVFLRMNDSIIDNFTFNDQILVDKYKLFLEEKSIAAILEQMAKASQYQVDFYQHMKPLIPLLNDSLSFFKMKYGLLTHDRLKIIDTNGNSHSLHDMPVKIKELIAAFLQVQKESIINFLVKIESKETPSLTINKNNVENTPLDSIPQEENHPIKVKKSKLDIKSIYGEDMIDLEQLCIIFDLSKRAAQSLREKGILPYTFFGNKYLFKVSDIRAVLDKNFHYPDSA